MGDTKFGVFDNI